MRISEEQEFHNFRMYHQLQYDRIGKIESRREVFSKFVITISAGIYLIGFGDISSLNLITGVVLPVLIILINIDFLIFANRSMYFIRKHKKRAKLARTHYAPQLNTFNDVVDEILGEKKYEDVHKSESKKDQLSRHIIYQSLHISIIVFAIVCIISYCCYGNCLRF